MAEQSRELANAASAEQIKLGCNTEVRDLAEQLVAGGVEHEITGQQPANVRCALLTSSVADLMVGPEGLLREPGQYSEIPWAVYIARSIECLEPVTIGACQAPASHGGQSDRVSAVFVRFCWKDNSSGEVRETVKIEAFESRPDALPIMSSVVDFRVDEENDYTTWRAQARPAMDEDEALHILSTARILYGTERLFD